MYFGPKFPFLIDTDWINVAEEKGEPFTPIPANLSMALYDPQCSDAVDQMTGAGASGVLGVIWDEAQLNQFLEWFTGAPSSKITIRTCGRMGEQEFDEALVWFLEIDLVEDRIRVTFEVA